MLLAESFLFFAFGCWALGGRDRTCPSSTSPGCPA